MPETPESLRERAERIYRFETTDHPLAVRLLEAHVAGVTPDLPPLNATEQMQLAWKMCSALRIALFDLAEQLDALLGGQVKPE